MQKITIDNIDSIKKVNRDDEIEFKLPGETLKYTVQFCFLNCCGDYNGRIFTLLHVDKMEFCERYYGYRPMDGDCPECGHDDYPALLKLIKGIFEEIERQYPGSKPATKPVKQVIPTSGTVKLPNSKTSTFKIIL